MKTSQKILFFFVLPIITPLLLPLKNLNNAWIGIIFVAALFGALGFLLLRGSSRALTLCIFLLGLNAIVRLMTFFQWSTFLDGTFNIPFILTSFLSIGLSIYLLLRLDRVDVRTMMIS